jgi:hypothetical protein
MRLGTDRHSSLSKEARISSSSLLSLSISNVLFQIFAGRFLTHAFCKVATTGRGISEDEVLLSRVNAAG